MALSLVAAGSVLLGCQSTLLTYKGARLTQGAAIPLVEGASHVELMTLPPGTASMAFGYSGEARSTGDDDGGGGDTPFWFEPVVR
jgi:hypothetical protein